VNGAPYFINFMLIGDSCEIFPRRGGVFVSLRKRKTEGRVEGVGGLKIIIEGGRTEPLIGLHLGGKGTLLGRYIFEIETDEVLLLIGGGGRIRKLHSIMGSY